ncbi:MAG: DNA translocase FtsK 4TM domain-containing protein [Clostridium sp.]|uniref:FtsK/SpoIIIE family DNA translocase n=1 Tax=Clostridium sp. TaxID=1506 RepID=UPI002FC6DBD5
MPRNNKHKKQKDSITERYKTEIYGLFLFAFSILVGFSIYIKPSGLIGVWMRDLIFSLFGITSYLIPIVMLGTSILFILKKGYMLIEKKFICISLFVITIITMIHVGYSLGESQVGFIEKLTYSAQLGMEKMGGGIISELIALPLILMFGSVGTYIILICIGIILTIIITEVSLVDILYIIIDKIRNTFNYGAEAAKKVKEKVPNKTEDKPSSIIIDEDEKSASIDEDIKIFDSFEKDKKEEDISKPFYTVMDSNVSAKKEVKTSKVEKESAVTIIDSIESINTEIIEKEYIFPDIKLLGEINSTNNQDDKKSLLENAKLLEDTLQSFNVDAKVMQVRRGPSVTRYELQPSPGVKVSKIVNLSDDLALSLATSSVRIEAPIPGKAAVGIEVPNKNVSPVSLREVIESHEFIEFGSNLSFALGKDITGKCMVTDIGKMPHLLIAGATGSGKSVCINTLITSLIYKSSPEDVKMIMIDPKVVELSIYNGIPHLLIPVVTDPKKAASALYWAVNEMNDRYKIFAENSVRNIDGYNNLVKTKGIGKKMPKIVIIIDELADLMMASPSDVEDSICRLSQMARAAGLHLIIATQRPSVDVITGVIKANIPSRISFAVSSQTDSRTILDMGGAEKLLGRGDMLFLPIGENKPIRVQGAFISEEDVENIVNFLKESSDEEYSEEAIEEIDKIKPESKHIDEDDDVLLNEAIQVAVDYGQASASMLQRRLRIGFNRASRLIESMEQRGIVGPQEGSKPRQVLISKDDLSNYDE